MFIAVTDTAFAIVKRKLVKFRLVQEKSTGSSSSFRGFIMNQFNDLPLVG